MTKTLADRIEALEGPDSSVHEEIAEALGWTRVANPTCAGGLVGKWYNEKGVMRDLPWWIGSIDAAMTLVPDGWVLRKLYIGKLVPFTAEVSVGPDNGGWTGHSDYSFPQAICAAALRAKAVQS